jgi:hypothetical protein
MLVQARYQQEDMYLIGEEHCRSDAVSQCTFNSEHEHQHIGQSKKSEQGESANVKKRRRAGVWPLVHLQD